MNPSQKLHETNENQHKLMPYTPIAEIYKKHGNKTWIRRPLISTTPWIRMGDEESGFFLVTIT